MRLDAITLPNYNPGFSKNAIYFIPEIENAIAASGYAVSKYSRKAQEYDANSDAEAYERVIDANAEDDSSELFKQGIRFAIGKHITKSLFGTFVNGALAVKTAVGYSTRQGVLLALRASMSIATTMITTLATISQLALSAGLAIVKSAFRLLARHPVALAGAAGVTALSYVAFKIYTAKASLSNKDIRDRVLAFENEAGNVSASEAAIAALDTIADKEYSSIKEEAKARNQQKKVSELAKEATKAAKNISYKQSSNVQPTAINFEGTNAEKLEAAKAFLKNTTHFSAESEIYETMIKEGWDKLDASSADDYSRFGINFNKNRSKEFIRNLTAEQAFNIYKKEYWDAADVDNVPDILKRMHFNTAVNMGVGAAKEILRKSDGTLEGYATARWNRYNDIVKRDPSKRKYLKGWRRRTIQEYNESLKIAQQMYNRFLKQSSKLATIQPNAAQPISNGQNQQPNDPIYVAKDRQILQFDNI